MPLLRRAAPLDPQVVARLQTVLPDGRSPGWTPPGPHRPAADAAGAEAAAEVAGAVSEAPEVTAGPGRAGPGSAAAGRAIPGRPGRGRHAARGGLREGSAAVAGDLPRLGAAEGPDVDRPDADRLYVDRPAADRSDVDRLAVDETAGGGFAPGAAPAAERRPWSWSSLGRADDPADDPSRGRAAEGDDDSRDAPRTAAPDRRTGLSGGSVLQQWRDGRVDPGRRGLAALVLVALLAAGLAGWVVLRARPHAVVPPAVVAAGVPVPGSATSSTPPAAGDVVVAVGGKVVHPGLLRLPLGSRVDDALRAAGGALPDADLGTLNLARRLVDGEQVLVGVPQPVSDTTGPAGVSGAGGLVDLNAATAAQFDALPGIGPVLAQKLVDWRTQHGRFGSVDQLREVSGIGESKYDEIKDKVRV